MFKFYKTDKILNRCICDYSLWNTFLYKCTNRNKLSLACFNFTYLFSYLFRCLLLRPKNLSVRDVVQCLFCLKNDSRYVIYIYIIINGKIKLKLWHQLSHSLFTFFLTIWVSIETVASPLSSITSKRFRMKSSSEFFSSNNFFC